MNLSKIFIILFIFTSYTINAQEESFVMTQIGSNNLLNTPWDLHYGPDSYLWVTERENGVVVRVNPETAVRDELINITEVSSTASQDGLLGMALHNGLLTGNPYVYLSYTYLVSGQRVQKIVRYTYQVNGDDGTLSMPLTVLDNLPSSNDHNSGRLIFGSDEKLYYTIGDQGVKICDSNLAQFLPTQQEIDVQDWSNYPGKILRLNLDGSIPSNNPVIDGLKSHIYSYGHRNPQGIVFGSNGILYADEHGPSSDDEVNIINSGKNYGWPYVAGIKDNLVYSNDGCHSQETSFNEPNYQDPLMSIFLPDTPQEPGCTDSWMCRPNIAPSSMGIYESNTISNWSNSLLITSLKKGRVYRLNLDESGTNVLGDITQHFYTQNRYRDIVVDPDGKSFYVITDVSGKTSDASGMNVLTNVQNPGAILKFTYEVSLSTENQGIETFVNIWPNPTSNILNIELKNNIEKDFKAELINSVGQIVKKISKLQPGLNKTKVDNLPAGVYFLKIHSKNKSWHKHIIMH